MSDATAPSARHSIERRTRTVRRPCYPPSVTAPPPADPPRALPLLLGLQGLFGGLAAPIAWSVLAVILLVTAGLAQAVDVATPWALRQGAEVVTGEISGIEGTHVRIGGDDDTAGTPVLAYHYTFEHGAQGWTGTSYATGHVADVGDPATIELAPEAPSRSRIVGMRASPLPPATLLSLLLALGTLPVIGWTLRRGRRSNRLLRQGLLAHGRLVEKNPTSVTVNDRPVFAYLFQFPDAQDRMRRASVRTAQGWRLEDDVVEPVLYDPASPDDAVLLDALPGHPTLGLDGQLAVESSARAVLVLMPPVLAVLAGLGCVLALLSG